MKYRLKSLLVDLVHGAELQFWAKRIKDTLQAMVMTISQPWRRHGF